MPTPEEQQKAEEQKTADEKAAADKAAADQATAGGETPPTFDAWFEAQDETTKGLITGHTKGLKSALDSERGMHSDLEKQLREAASKLEEGSEARTALEEQAATLAADSDRADFYETAHAEGITNLRLAWLAVGEDNSLRDRRGNVNFETLKEKYPELFAGEAKPPPGHPGAGAGAQDKQAGTMNDYILEAAGRGRR